MTITQFWDSSEREIRREGFFAFFEDIGAHYYTGNGFELFTTFHFTVLIIMAVFVTMMCLIYVRLDEGRRRNILKIIALIILATEVMKQLTFLLIHGDYWPFLLPFHLCAMAMFIHLIHAFWPNKTTGEISYALCLPGAITALIFSGWMGYPIINFYFLHSLLFHVLHVAFTLMLICGGDLKPDVKQLWRPVVFLAIVVPLIYAFNVWQGTNFFFVNAGAEASPLEFFIYHLGVPWFLIPFAGMLLIVWFLKYLPWVLAQKRVFNSYKK